MSETVQRLRAWLPTGETVPENDWRNRHRVIVTVAALHVPVLLLAGILAGEPLSHLLPGLGLIGLGVGVAVRAGGSRRLRTLASTFALVTSSAVAVHLADGLIEAHFHFFVVVTIVLLYQDWAVFGLAFAYVVVHHVVLGTLAPDVVFSHEAARSAPLVWAMIHGASMLGVSAAGLVAWRFTERERQRADAYAADLSEALRAKDELLAAVSHDLRSPLVVIDGCTTMLAEVDGSTPPERIRQLADVIRRNGGHLADLVDDLLTAAALRSGGLEPAAERVDVRELVDDVLTALELGGQVAVEGGCGVHADPRHLRRILTNLLSNARKYGRPPVRVTATATGGLAEIRVTDGGDGVPEGLVDQLFEPFVQRETPNTVAHGVGLGLSVVRDLARLNGGDVRYRTGDAGAVFVVTLPRSPLADRDQAVGQVRPEPTAVREPSRG